MNNSLHCRQASAPLLVSVRLTIVTCLCACIFCTELFRINFAIPFVFAPEVNDSLGESCTEVLSVPPKSADDRLAWTLLDRNSIVIAYYLPVPVVAPLGLWLCSRYSGKQILLTCIGLSSLLTIFVPSLAYLSSVYVIAVRLVLGCLRALILPALIDVVKNWIPAAERMTVFFMGVFGMKFFPRF
ncbi:unnamed protein product [Soboliphyme baturini]|uniref:MFS domain-containing protein n=1 Tax=Soboliphyme baturini TaxID=241478 RepID=A0A183J2L5_9BILA|nr:unnamed protein product [Soboliphyme baturini]